MAIALVFAFLAGVLTILAPCTLPVVPLVLGVGSTGGRRRGLGVILGFCLTFVSAAIILGAALAAVGIGGGGLRVGSAVVLGIAGLAIAVPRFEALAERALASVSRAGARLVGGHLGGRRSEGLAGGIVLGGAIGLVWAPCVGPIMAAVVAVAATGPTLETVAIALAYVAGAAVPVALILAVGRRAAGWFAGAVRPRRSLQRALGAGMLITALAVTTGFDLTVETAVADALPAGWSTALTGIEQRQDVQEELDTLRTEPSTGTWSNGPLNGQGPDGALTAGLPPAISDHLPSGIALEDLGPAPEFRGIQAWLNSDPLTTASLRGKVVLVEFWTFSCVNCLHVQPFVKAWYERYAAAGFVVVGVHTPELAFEHDLANVRDAVARAGLRYPVALDPDFATWNAYRNSYWPAFYFIDRSGRIRHVHFGEGDYEGSEQVIRELLAQPR